VTTSVRSQPCIACPYRRDVPSGVWSAQEYDKLVDYDSPTSEQPFAPFACHATPEHFCHGWAVVHSNRGHAYELLALRIARLDVEDVPMAGVALFQSGYQVAKHGKADIEDPSDEAIEMAERLINKYMRLQRRHRDDPR